MTFRSRLHLRATFGNQTRRCAFKVILQALEKFVLAEAGRDRVENFRNYGPWNAPQRPACPEQTGVKCNRNAWHAFGRVEMGYTDLVARLRPRRPTRAFGKNDQLLIVREFDAGTLDHIAHGLRTAAAPDRHHSSLDGQPAKDRNQLQLALEYEERIFQQRQQ